MELSGSTSITLGFSLTALQELADPADVIESARRWSENIGVLTESPAIDATDFAYDHAIKFDFKSGPRDLDTALEKAMLMMATDRHIYIGTTDEQQAAAEEQTWEYLPVEEAAAAAEWELTTTADDITYEGDLLELGEQIEEDTHVEIPLNTLRWHQVNRGEKNWIVKAAGEEFNETTLTEDRVALLHRGVGESHKLWAVIQDVATFESIETLLDEVSVEKVRPHSNDENVVERMRDTYGDADEYIAVRVETIDPEQNPELFETQTA